MSSFVLSKQKITSSIGAIFSFSEKFLETAEVSSMERGRRQVHGNPALGIR